MSKRKKKRLLAGMDVAKGLLKNFIDIDEVISPKGRRPFYIPPEAAKPKPAPGFSLPHPDVPARERPTWCDTVKIGNARWSMGDLDYVDCEDIDRPDSGIKFWRGEYYYTSYAAKRIVDRLDGWHIPTVREWFEAKMNSYFNQEEFRNVPIDGVDMQAEAWNVRRLTMLLGVLPLGHFDTTLTRAEDPLEFGEHAYYLAANGMLMFSDSLGVMSIWWSHYGWNPKGKYMPVRLVRDAGKV
jgi:uncharacterized protein (TIGR02145 family)